MSQIDLVRPTQLEDIGSILQLRIFLRTGTSMEDRLFLQVPISRKHPSEEASVPMEDGFDQIRAQ